MSLRSALRLLLASALGLPIVGALLKWVSSLLTAMGDAAAANVLERIQLAVGIVWLASLVGLVIVMAISSLDDSRSKHPEDH